MGEPLTGIILDTDLAMGEIGTDVDDGFALALAVADPGLRLDVVTTVGGNTDVHTATRLSTELLEVLGRTDIPVVPGAASPLDPKLRWADREPVGLPGPTAAAEIVSRVMAAPGDLTIVAIGPLTNVALALMLEPRIATAVREIVVMGGVFLRQTNYARIPGEFNFWCDPDAAQAVLASGAPLRLVGLDVTEQVRLTRADAARLAEGGEFGKLASVHADHWISHWLRVKPGEEREHDSCALHDPLAVAVVTRPGLVTTWQDAQVAVETAGRITRGVAIADLLERKNPPKPNCQIATEVDAEAFSTLFVERMADLP